MKDNQELEYARHRLRFAKRRFADYASKPAEHVSPAAYADALRRVEAARQALVDLGGVPQAAVRLARRF